MAVCPIENEKRAGFHTTALDFFRIIMVMDNAVWFFTISPEVIDP
jgi:hypothetical protein